MRIFHLSNVRICSRLDTRAVKILCIGQNMFVRGSNVIRVRETERNGNHAFENLQTEMSGNEPSRKFFSTAYSC